MTRHSFGIIYPKTGITPLPASQDTNSGWRNNREFPGGIGVANLLLIDDQGKIISTSSQYNFAHTNGLNTYSDSPAVRLFSTRNIAFTIYENGDSRAWGSNETLNPELQTLIEDFNQEIKGKEIITAFSTSKSLAALDSNGGLYIVGLTGDNDDINKTISNDEREEMQEGIVDVYVTNTPTQSSKKTAQ